MDYSSITELTEQEILNLYNDIEIKEMTACCCNCDNGSKGYSDSFGGFGSGCNVNPNQCIEACRRACLKI